ncbi:MAG: class I SAM-dependent methyltransferase [Deltaproteobacteria bacterium]|nr:class I SAM-dependent methyltransferase [Deltaproteobacteria bacterium]MBW2361188.1 class I SAM-dependent methyltransferase [Deltaproteobacteria bacterium]
MAATASASPEPVLDTSKRFGFEWDRYRDLYPHYEEQFLGWVAPLEPADFAGRDVLDAGCGMGRNSRWAAKYGARSVLAVDYAELAVNAARAGLADLPNVAVERQSLYDLDRSQAFDLCFSIGVIHHLEFPERAVARLHRALRPGGRLVVWLYGYEGNEAWVRFFRVLHPLLKRLPPSLVHALAYLVSLPIFTGLKLGVHRWLRLGGSSYLDAVARFPFAHLHKIVFDQLLPDIAHYYKRDEVTALFAQQAWGDISIHHNRGYSWTVICQRA